MPENGEAPEQDGGMGNGDLGRGVPLESRTDDPATHSDGNVEPRGVPLGRLGPDSSSAGPASVIPGGPTPAAPSAPDSAQGGYSQAYSTSTDYGGQATSPVAPGPEDAQPYDRDIEDICAIASSTMFKDQTESGRKIREEIDNLGNGSLLADSTQVHLLQLFLNIAARTIAENVYAQIPDDQKPRLDQNRAYGVENLREELMDYIQLVRQTPSYISIINAGQEDGYAGIREKVSVIAASLLETDSAEQVLQKTFGQHRPVVENANVAKETEDLLAFYGDVSDGFVSEDVANMRTYLPQIPELLGRAAAAGVTPELEQLGGALKSVLANICSYKLRQNNPELYGSLEALSEVVREGRRVIRLRGYLQGFDASTARLLTDFEIGVFSSDVYKKEIERKLITDSLEASKNVGEVSRDNEDLKREVKRLKELLEPGNGTQDGGSGI